ncbi:BTB domain-containing protein [Madurella fahalii]|uniref:BTB domain-containing protein n=1 Tax=Madurella fahalii TaxID=1157608 RepID=A0ABQ0GK57_9PEZI
MYDYTLDPEGDVILTLRNPNAPFAVWNKDTAENSENPDPPLANEPPPGPVTFRVSSRHLILASPVFKAALTGPWKEGIKAQNGCLEIEAEDWDVDALLIAMNVIHCRLNRVPLALGLEDLSKVAGLVDYYQLHDAFYLHKLHWIPALKENLPKLYNRELMLWISIAWVFNDDDIFTDTTHVAIQHHTGYLQPLELPIPSTVIDRIVEKRNVTIAALVGALHELIQAFLDESEGCSFECRSILLGALQKQLHNPKPHLHKTRAAMNGLKLSDFTQSKSE